MVDQSMIAAIFNDLKLRTWILAMHLENSISGNNLIIKEQPFGTLCYY